MMMTRYVQMADVPSRVHHILRRRYAMHNQADRKVRRSISTLLSALDMLPSFQRVDLPASLGGVELGIGGVETVRAHYTNYILGIFYNTTALYTL